MLMLERPLSHYWTSPLTLMHYCHLHSCTVPPVVLNSPDNYTSLLRNPVTLQCLTAGYPPPEVTWLKNGAPLDSTDVRSVLCAVKVAVTSVILEIRLHAHPVGTNAPCTMLESYQLLLQFLSVMVTVIQCHVIYVSRVVLWEYKVICEYTFVIIVFDNCNYSFVDNYES